MQSIIGQTDKIKGIVDLVSMREIYFNGKYGEHMEIKRLTNSSANYALYMK
jgi:hypothetical protein